VFVNSVPLGGAGAVPPLSNIAEVREAGAAGLPADLPPSTYALIERTARSTPDAPALSFFLDVGSHHRPERWTYRQLFADVTRCANLLTNIGVGPGEAVAVLLPNLPEMHLALWGGEAAGIVMPINPLLEPAAIAALLRTAKAKALITLAPFPGVDVYEKAAAALAEAPEVRDVVLVELASHVRGWRRLPARMMAWKAGHAAWPLPPGVRTHRFATLLRAAPADRLVSGRAIFPGDVASYFCTGGTTGVPKIAAHSHANEVANAWMTKRMLGDALAGDAIVFCGLPLFHVNAMMTTGLAPFFAGGHVVLGPPQGFRAPGLIARLWEVLAHHRITAFSGVPTLFSALLEHPTKGHDLSAFRYAFCGAAPMSVELLRHFEAEAGVSVIEGYGMTEAACICSLNPVDGERRVGSVGLPLPMQSVAILHLDENGRVLREAATDEVGVVALAGPNIFQGYLSPEHNAKVWIDGGDGRRWLNTGDLGRVDAEGYLWLTGRAKDLIIRGGHNIDPAVIEDALHAHPEVALAAAIGRPDPYAGEVPVAYVQLRPGSHADEHALMAHVRGRIAERAAMPKLVRVRESLPLTPIGKIFKPALRLAEMAEAAKDALSAEGVPAASVEARNDPRHGSVVVVVAAPEDAERVRQTLETFAFAVEVETVAAPAA
jgi:fatty-acyl-CoA synthase